MTRPSYLERDGMTCEWMAALAGFILVAFGQPAFSPFLGVFASLIGYGLFFWAILKVPSAKKRFYYGAVWFGLVQAVQLSWLISHPFAYIYGLYLFLCLGIGVQFGALCALMSESRVMRWTGMLALSGFYTLLEWSRLFFFSGFSLNPIGLAMTSSLFGLQNASLAGVFGLTFFTLLVNMAFLRVLMGRSFNHVLSFGILACLPYLFGFFQIYFHQEKMDAAPKIKVLLVQTAFPVEEGISFPSFEESIAYVQEEWASILHVLQSFYGKPIDLIALPEYVVPYGTYMAVFPYEDIKKLFEDAFGKNALDQLPPLKEPLALKPEGFDGGRWRVTNAYLAQAIANIFHADVVAGLQDDQWTAEDEKQSYSAAFYFWPGGDLGFRYEKRVLLPLGEYIPFEFCRKYAREYGVTGSFEPGQEAKVFPGCKAPFGLCICYEETYGHLMLENRAKGAELLINLTSDVWYPGSRLPKQHFDHARIRTVEAGIPLIRACNTGITSAVNSLGEVVASLKAEDEWVRQGLFAEVPLYSYRTFYSWTGDFFIIGVAGLFCLFLRNRA